MASEAEREAFKDLLVYLDAATSAYEQFAAASMRPVVRDAFYSTRLADFQKAVVRGHSAYRKLFVEPEPTPAPVYVDHDD